MKLYEYQRSGSFIYLGPSCSVSIFSNFFSSVTVKPIEAKFHVALSWDGGMEVTSNGLGHMTKMAAMPIYGKNVIKSSSLADDLETWYTASDT